MSEDLKPFMDAMQAEYMRHYPKKGDSWREAGFSPSGEIYDWIDTEDYLWDRIQYLVNNYDPANLDELVDIANLCAMLWLRISEQSPKKS